MFNFTIQHECLPRHLQSSKVTIFGLVFLIALLILNSYQLICLVIKCKNQQTLKISRYFKCIMICQLINNLLYISTTSLLNSLDDFFSLSMATFNVFSCKLIGVSVLFSWYYSFFTLTLLSVERMISVYNYSSSKRSRKIIKQNQWRILLSSAFVCSLLCSPLIFSLTIFTQKCTDIKKSTTTIVFYRKFLSNGRIRICGTKSIVMNIIQNVCGLSFSVLCPLIFITMSIVVYKIKSKISMQAHGSSSCKLSSIKRQTTNILRYQIVNSLIMSFGCAFTICFWILNQSESPVNIVVCIYRRYVMHALPTCCTSITGTASKAYRIRMQRPMKCGDNLVNKMLSSTMKTTTSQTNEEDQVRKKSDMSNISSF